MAKREMTDAERQELRDRLARGRQTAAANRQRAKDEAEYDPPRIVPGELVPDPDFDEVVVEEPLDEFGRFLQTLDAETRDLLGIEELRTIYADQQKKAREEKRAATKKAVAARAKHHALVAEGLLSADALTDQAWLDRMNETVRHTIDLPELGDIGIRVDQKVFLHGHTYMLTRAEHASIISMEYQAQQQELLFEGKDKRHWLRRRARGSMAAMRDEEGAVRIH